MITEIFQQQNDDEYSPYHLFSLGSRDLSILSFCQSCLQQTMRNNNSNTHHCAWSRRKRAEMGTAKEEATENPWLRAFQTQFDLID